MRGDGKFFLKVLDFDAFWVLRGCNFADELRINRMKNKKLWEL